MRRSYLFTSESVSEGHPDKMCDQISDAIGVAEPTSVMVDTFGTGAVDDALIEQAVRAVFDLRPYGIIKMLDLLKPVYRPTASYGHFGREEPGFSWERTDKVEALRDAAGLKAREAAAG